MWTTDDIPAEPPQEVLAALDHGAARLSALYDSGVRIALRVDGGGQARVRLTNRYETRDIVPSELLALISGEAAEATVAMA